MRYFRFICLSLALAISLTAALVTVAGAQDIPVRPVDSDKRAAIVDAVLEKLNRYYIDTDVAAKMDELVRRKLADGEYNDLTRLRPFVGQLTTDLHQVSNDLHLGVWPIEYAILTEETSEEDRKRLLAKARYYNHGINAVKRLPGNIGYLELSYFEEVNIGGDTAVAAMNLLANSDALIIDVRRNGGGSGVVRLIMSYLFDEPIHAANIYSRIKDATEQSWTLSYVPGPRFTKIPIYVIQSRRSASAAEGLSYVLKAIGRATIVGERSKGAANPIEEFIIPELSICMAVSAYRNTNPITGTCWEGIGVEPDIEVDGELALYAAGLEAMKKLVESPDEDDEINLGRQWALELYEARFNQVVVEAEELEQFVGQYGDSYSVRLAHGSLKLERPRQLPVTLVPLGSDAFAYEEEEGKVQFKRDGSGAVVEMEILYMRGSRSTVKRSGD